MLPLSFIVNVTFPYEEKLEAARRYLHLRGITDPRPIRKSLAPPETAEPRHVVRRPRPKLARATAH